MLLQAQDFVMTRNVPFDEPIGMLLVLALLAVLAIGVLVESDLAAIARTWLGGGTHKLPRRVATAGQRG